MIVSQLKVAIFLSLITIQSLASLNCVACSYQLKIGSGILFDIAGTCFWLIIFLLSCNLECCGKNSRYCLFFSLKLNFLFDIRLFSCD